MKNSSHFLKNLYKKGFMYKKTSKETIASGKPTEFQLKLLKLMPRGVAKNQTEWHALKILEDKGYIVYDEDAEKYNLTASGKEQTKGN